MKFAAAIIASVLTIAAATANAAVLTRQWLGTGFDISGAPLTEYFIPNPFLDSPPPGGHILTVSGVDPLNLGATLPGSTAQTALLVSNIGSVSASIVAYDFAGPFGPYAGIFFNGTCAGAMNVPLGTPLLAGQSCRISIEFHPDKPGKFNGLMAISYDVAAVPLPAGLPLLLSGMAAAGIFRWRRGAPVRS